MTPAGESQINPSTYRKWVSAKASIVTKYQTGFFSATGSVKMWLKREWLWVSDKGHRVQGTITFEYNNFLSCSYFVITCLYKSYLINMHTSQSEIKSPSSSSNFIVLHEFSEVARQVLCNHSFVNIIATQVPHLIVHLKRKWIFLHFWNISSMFNYYITITNFLLIQ